MKPLHFTKAALFCGVAPLLTVGAFASPGAAQDGIDDTMVVASPIELQAMPDPPLLAQPDLGGTAVVPHNTIVEPEWRRIRSFWRRIRSFEGQEVTPFWGEVRSFWGNAGPFEGNTAEFWGRLQTYNNGWNPAAVTPEWRRIRSFWDEAGTAWGATRPNWDAGNYVAVAGQLRTLRDRSANVWGAAVQARTGRDFNTAFADPLLARYGIDLNDPASLARLDANEREHFFLEWYDGLMQFSGADNPDHWMKQVNWTPKLTQTQGSGVGVTIGLVDYSASRDPDVAGKVVFNGGFTGDTNNHGAAVLSLIMASHDGRGVMGIAPGAKVAGFNPFDAAGTADFSDLTRGIVAVTGRGASVVNLSLGVPGFTFHPEWRGLFRTSAVDTMKDHTLYVIAAGNSGVTQLSHVEMNGALDSTFILVGSVTPGGDISDFSNRPGNVCLLDGGVCKNTGRWNGQNKFFAGDYLKESGLLMNRFIVAPGEMLLVSDGAGGVTRMSGTSFAAPLVSGTAALIVDRWPWLKKYPRDIAKAILESATDLGAPGPDPVFGMGLLNVEAAQSPLNFNRMKFYLYEGTRKTEYKADFLRQNGTRSIWTTSNAYFVAFEKLDSQERDFLIPLSSRLVGTMRNGEYFQDFVYNRFQAWSGGRTYLTAAAPHGLGFSDVSSTPATSVSGGWTMAFSSRMSGTAGRDGASSLTSAVRMVSPSGDLVLSVGNGDGAVFLGGTRLTQMTSDFDPYAGGVNPLLGFASGGAHVATRFKLADGLELSGGVTQNRRHVLDTADAEPSDTDRMLLTGLAPTSTFATNLRLDYRAADWLTVSASLTQLAENDSLLGVQSLAEQDFANGAATNGLTVGFESELGSGFGLFASATAARGTAGDGASPMRIVGMTSTAFQAGVGKRGLLGTGDQLRLSLAQPLTVESGSLEMDIVKVVDRNTGEQGTVTETFDIGAPERRRFVAEALYGAPLLDGAGSFSLFARGELRAVDAETPRVMAGMQATLAF